DSGVVAVAGIDAFKHGHVDAGLFELATYRGGNALPVRLFVVQDGDQFGLDGFDDELCSGRTLLVVATNGTENEFKVFAIGDGRRGGRRRYHDDAFIVVYGRGGNGSARANVPYHVMDAIVHNPVGHDRPLLGLT